MPEMNNFEDRAAPVDKSGFIQKLSPWLLLGSPGLTFCVLVHKNAGTKTGCRSWRQHQEKGARAGE